MSHELVSFLRRRIKTHGVINVIGYGEGHPLVCPVDRAARGVNKVRYCVMPTRFKDIHKADDICVYVSVRVFEGVADTRLGGKVNHPTELLTRKERIYRFTISNVPLEEGKAPGNLSSSPLHARNSCFLETDIIVVIKAINPHDIIASTN